MTAATALVSFGALVALWVVCNAQMWRRYYPDVQMRFTRYAWAGLGSTGMPAAAACIAGPTLLKGAKLVNSRRAMLPPMHHPAPHAVACSTVSPCVLNLLARYGTVEASFHQSKSLSWMPTLGQRLSTGRRKVLVGVNMLAVNAVSIGTRRVGMGGWVCDGWMWGCAWVTLGHAAG